MENKIITYENIENANKLIKPMTIKRKDKNTGKTISKSYSEVSQRIKAYRSIYPCGTIETEMSFPSENTCIFRAFIKDEKGNLLGTGTAMENQNSSIINKTNYIENCETSAVGRALGMCGFGIETSIASAEEVQNAIEKQNIEDELMSEEQIKIIANLDVELKEHLRKVYKKDPTKLTKIEANNAIKSLKKNGLIKSKKDIEIEKKENEEVF